MKRFSTLAIMLCLMATTMKAQMSYQVSLLNTATGEPRANVTVGTIVTITNSQNETIHTQTQNATTNDLGVMQLVVGNAETFKNIDTGKLPLFIEVTVEGVKIGKSQIMTVPVAEVANTLKSSFTKEELLGTWVERVPEDYGPCYITFSSNRCEFKYSYGVTTSGAYIIEGNNIYFIHSDNVWQYRMYNNVLYDEKNGGTYTK